MPNTTFSGHDTDYGTSIKCVIVEEVAVVNYPNEYNYTLIAEYMQLNGQRNAFATIYKEYLTDIRDPVLTKEIKALRDKCIEEGEILERQVGFAGRLGTYAHLNMDVGVKQGRKNNRGIFKHHWKCIYFDRPMMTERELWE